MVKFAHASCPKGEHPDSGACAYDTGAPVDDSAKWVSDEKPPKTTTGEWQTGKFQIINLPAQATVDDIVRLLPKIRGIYRREEYRI